MSYDIVLRGGTIVDGTVRRSQPLEQPPRRTCSFLRASIALCLPMMDRMANRAAAVLQGDAPYVGDIAIKDGLIAAVGASVEGQGVEEVDASGKHVCP